jgi:hypothetical protein
MTQKRYSFPADLTQVIVNALAARPWHEVNTLMGAIQTEVAQQDAAQPEPMVLPPIVPPQASAQD